MLYLFVKRTLYICSVWVFSLVTLLSQQVDTTSYYQLSEVEVIEKVRPSVMREGAPLQQLGRTDIERLGIQDLSEAVKRFSGVSVKDYGGIGGLKTVSVRSLGAQHTAVNYDGITITDAQSGQVDISRFSLDNIETISLSIGQSDNIFQPARMFASAGALSIQTSKPIFIEKPFNLRVKMKGGSFGLFNPTIRYEHKLSNIFSASAHAEWLSAKSSYPFKLKNGDITTNEKRKNSDIQSLRLEGNLYGYFNNGGILSAKLYYFDSERGLPGSVILYNDYAKERLWDNNFFTQIHYKKALSNLFTFQAQSKYNYAFSKYRDINDKYANGMQEDRNTQQDVFASAGLLFTPIKQLSTSLTSDISYADLNNNFINGPSPTRLNSLTALAAQYKSSQLTVTGSLLGTYITDEVKNGDRPEDRKRISPAISLSVRPLQNNSLRVRLAYKDIFRVPTFTDLYYLRMGNTNLRPEKAIQYNAGITWSGNIGEVIRHLNFSIDSYYNKVEDKIVALPTMHIWKMMNFGEVDIKGLDINLVTEIPFQEKITFILSSGYSYQKAIDITDETEKNYRDQIPYTPKHSGNINISIENPWVNISYNLTAVGERYSLPQNIKSNLIESYIEHNLSINKEILLKKCRIRLQGEILNIGNTSYDIIQYYPMPGRSWRLSTSIYY